LSEIKINTIRDEKGESYVDIEMEVGDDVITISTWIGVPGGTV